MRRPGATVGDAHLAPTCAIGPVLSCSRQPRPVVFPIGKPEHGRAPSRIPPGQEFPSRLQKASPNPPWRCQRVPWRNQDTKPHSCATPGSWLPLCSGWCRSFVRAMMGRPASRDAGWEVSWRTMDMQTAASIAQAPPSRFQMMSLPLNCSSQDTSEQICQLDSTARLALACQPDNSVVNPQGPFVCALAHASAEQVGPH